MQIEYRKIDELTPYENNPRINDHAVEAVASSIQEFGFKVPVIIDKDDVVIAGHTRIKAARQLGMDEVPTIKADDLTPEQVRTFRLADNKTAELAYWDHEMLNVEIEDLINLGVDNLDSYGFDLELDDFNLSAESEDEPEYVVPAKPKTKLGDIYQLGRHRLMCGDATVITDVERLMGGKKADMVFTDPPYNVNYEGGTKDRLTIKNDNMKDEDFFQFLYDSLLNMLTVSNPGSPIYICHSDGEGFPFRRAMKESGWLMKQCIIWVKSSLVIGRQDYQWKHEPILYGWKPGAAHRWYGGRKNTTVIEDNAQVVIEKQDDHAIIHLSLGLQQLAIKVSDYEVIFVGDDNLTTVWRIEKPQRNDVHPTMKPVSLCARAIRNSSKPSEIVLDVFGGSGSTLIAAERLNRTCYMMELDPKYCDVIIDRWEALTGKKAELLDK